MWKRLPITSITPFSLQDYPEHTAAIFWFSGCNMACGYCHNPELVHGLRQKLEPEQIIAFLESRRGLLEAIVLSGGECTLCHGLPWLAATLKEMGFLIKVDTNGTRPDMLRLLIEEELVDYIALDLKAPLGHYHSITGYEYTADITASLRLLTDCNLDCEIRTTVRIDLVDEAMVNAIIDALHAAGWRKPYYVQNYQHGETLGSLKPPKRGFDTSLIESASIDVRWRNFPEKR